MQTIIAGSRSCIDPAELQKALATCPWPVSGVIGGEAEGADYLGKCWALNTFGKNGYRGFRADWISLGLQAGQVRNWQLAREGQALIALWDGQSSGTAHMIDCARTTGLPVHIHYFNPNLYNSFLQPSWDNLMFGDTETRSRQNLKQVGVYKYREDASILLFAHAVGGGEITVDDFIADGGPSKLLQSRFQDPTLRFVFHNAQFDYTIIQQCMSKLAQYKPLTRWECMMIRSLAHALPGKLEKLCEVFGLPDDVSKMKRGKELLNLFSKPQKLTRKNKLEWFGPETHPSEWQEFKEYAKRDVAAMRAIYKFLPRWNYDPHNPDEITLEGCTGGQREYRLWLLDQEINRRGVKVDVQLAGKIIEVANREQARLASVTEEMTAHELESTTQTAKTIGYIMKTHGIEMPNLRSATVSKLIKDILEQEDNGYLPDNLRQLVTLLKLRLESSRTSHKKAERALQCVCSDGYARGLLQFDGAARTLRWAGRILQPQNFPRVDVADARQWWGVKDDEKLSDEKIALYVKYQVHAIKNGWVTVAFSNNIKAACTNVLRGMLIPDEGEAFYVSDLSNIEGRGLITLSGEQWKIEAFAAYDAGSGPDLYKLAFARAFGIDPADVSSAQRQIGKVLELAMGYEGGVGAFVTMAMTYNLDIFDLAEKAYPTLPKWVVAEAENFLAWKYEKPEAKYSERIAAGWIARDAQDILDVEKLEARCGLTEKEFITCDCLKRLWRRAHPETVQFWADCKAAFIAAILDTDEYAQADHLRYFYSKNPNTKIEEKTRIDGSRYWQVGAYLEFDRSESWVRIKLPSDRYLVYPSARMRSRGQASYMGVNPKNYQWQLINTYGGKIVENIVQAFSRDVMAWSMFDIEEAGYKIRLTVHDEIIATKNKLFGNHDEVSRFLAKVKSWCREIPLAAKGAELDRYEKA